MECPLTRATLKRLGAEARASVEDSHGECWTVSNRFSEALSECGVSAEVVEYQMGDARETHFCVHVPCEAVADYDGTDGHLIVDATLDQFSLEAWQDGRTNVGLEPAESLAGVKIYSPGAEERLFWYHRPNTPGDQPV